MLTKPSSNRSFGHPHCCTCSGLLLALSGESRGGQFMSAFGGVAEVHGRTASAAFDANDPNQTNAVSGCCNAVIAPWARQLGGLRSAPDCRPRRTFLHPSYSYASPFGPALLVTQNLLGHSIGQRRRPTLRRSGMPQFGNSGDKIWQAVAVGRHRFREGSFRATSGRPPHP